MAHGAPKPTCLNLKQDLVTGERTDLYQLLDTTGYSPNLLLGLFQVV
jgi:hypothetical protein